MQVQTVFDFAFAAHFRAAIFEVAHNRRAERGKMDANLVRASGARLDRDPGKLLARSFDDDIVCDGILGVVADALVDRRHALVAAMLAEAAFLGERRLDGAAPDLWHALGQGPVDLLRAALCQGP